MLVDTSILIRTLQPHHSLYAPAERAVWLLPEQVENFTSSRKTLSSYGPLRPGHLEENGLGMTAAKAAAELERIKGMFLFLPETPAIYPACETLVLRHRVMGKSSHDARLVAAMQAHRLTAILTFDAAEFSRYPGIEVVHPTDVTTRSARE
jgi:predicted nucleic acid-binding protein